MGTSGVAKVDSRHTNSTASATAATPQTTTPTEVQPAIGPMLSTSMAAVTAPARLQLPTQSMPAQTLRAPAAAGRVARARRRRR